MIIISSCLVGLATRYDGADNYREDIAMLLKQGKSAWFAQNNWVVYLHHVFRRRLLEEMVQMY
jgi:hypothetical protein